MTEHIWFEVSGVAGVGTFNTLEEANEALKEMRKGYPSHKGMSEENHAYWKRAGKKSHIFKVVQTKEEII